VLAAGVAAAQPGSYMIHTIGAVRGFGFNLLTAREIPML
jgi:hypothetical protein